MYRSTSHLKAQLPFSRTHHSQFTAQYEDKYTEMALLQTTLLQTTNYYHISQERHWFNLKEYSGEASSKIRFYSLNWGVLQERCSDPFYKKDVPQIPLYAFPTTPASHIPASTHYPIQFNTHPAITRFLFNPQSVFPDYPVCFLSAFR